MGSSRYWNALNDTHVGYRIVMQSLEEGFGWLSFLPIAFYFTQPGNFNQDGFIHFHHCIPKHQIALVVVRNAIVVLYIIGYSFHPYYFYSNRHSQSSNNIIYNKYLLSREGKLSLYFG